MNESERLIYVINEAILIFIFSSLEFFQQN